MKDSVRAFKNELRNYDYYLSRIKELNDQIEYCYHLLGGIKGLDPTKEPIHCPPNKDYEYKVRDDVERYTQLLNDVKAKLKSIDKILSLIETPLKEAIFDVYVNEKQMSSICKRLGLSSAGLDKRINKAIETALQQSDGII